MKRTYITTAIAFAIASLVGGGASASSHREAPLITSTPKVDGTDLYMFRSYEAGREGYVTLLANYIPLQDPSGGPNFFSLDSNATYAINVDNNGDAVADMSFQFRFTNAYQNLTIPVGGVNVAVPVLNLGSFGGTPSNNDGVKNLIETYTVSTVRGARLRTTSAPALNLTAGGSSFRKPLDNIGTKSVANYAAYAHEHIYRIGIDGCSGEGRVFVGQRKEGFSIAVGEIFDLFNLNPLGPTNGEPNDLAKKNITTIALELPISCLTGGGGGIIGAWTTAGNGAVRTGRTKELSLSSSQSSRLGMPLVNEVVIGVQDKDRFNASQPRDDAQFATYVTNPTLPAIIQTLFPEVRAPTLFPRTDLVATFLTGIDGLNKPAGVRPAEMLRLNTAIAPRAAASQATLGVLAGDTAGFPNGRRPGDDVIDISLRVAMGVLLPLSDAPSGQLPFTDGAATSATDFQTTFPYLNTPLPGDSE